MPAFDLRFIATPEDIPGCLVSVDASQRNVGDVAVSGGFVTSILNRAPTSLRNRRGRDQTIAKWWDAVEEDAGSAASVDLSAFSGAGGVSVPAGADFRLTEQLVFPAIVAGEFSTFFVVDHTPAGVPASAFEDGSGLLVALNNGFNNVAFLDGGAGGTGPAAISGAQYHSIQFGKATPISSPTANWRRNGAALFSAAYTPTNFGGSQTRIFGASGFDFVGKAGRMLFYTRRLVDTEVDFLESTIPGHFGVFAAPRVYVAPTAAPWTDPAGGAGELNRLNSVSGVTERYYKVLRGPGQPVSLLLEATISGALDTSSSFVAWYVEWPFQGTDPEPPIVQDASLPGVCRLDLTKDGHYLFELWRPGGGAILAHFDVTQF